MDCNVRVSSEIQYLTYFLFFLIVSLHCLEGVIENTYTCCWPLTIHTVDNASYEYWSTSIPEAYS